MARLLLKLGPKTSFRYDFLRAVGASIADVLQTLPSPSSKVFTNDAATYLITGGTGGLGRSITRWLAREGAKHIILLSRSGMSQTGVQELLKELRRQEVDVVVATCDVADLAQVQEVLAECQTVMPPIKGVIHGAMALRDALFENMSFADWQLNIMPRVQGALNLHHCLADADLDFYLILGSLGGIIGTVGQSAYAATNTFYDAFVSHRKDLGLPACVIDIGKIENVGYVAENKDREAEMNFQGFDSLVEDELLALVKAHITGAFSDNNNQQTITGLRLSPDKPLPAWASDPKFRNMLASVQSGASAEAGAGAKHLPIRDSLKVVGSPEQAVELICHALLEKLSRLLMIAVEDLDMKKPVVAYGLDSLVAGELRNWITADLGANLPLMELMNSASIELLAGKIASMSTLVDQSIEEKDGEGQ